MNCEKQKTLTEEIIDSCEKFFEYKTAFTVVDISNDLKLRGVKHDDGSNIRHRDVSNEIRRAINNGCGKGIDYYHFKATIIYPDSDRNGNEVYIPYGIVIYHSIGYDISNYKIPEIVNLQKTPLAYLSAKETSFKTLPTVKYGFGNDPSPWWNFCVYCDENHSDKEILDALNAEILTRMDKKDDGDVDNVDISITVVRETGKTRQYVSSILMHLLLKYMKKR